MPLYGNDGFKRLFKDGRVYTQANYPMAHPDGASAARSGEVRIVNAENGLQRFSVEPFPTDDTVGRR